MFRKIGAVLMSTLLFMGLSCPNKTQVNTYITLATSATVNGLKLAQALGATVSNDVITEAQKDGDDLATAYSEWAAATGDAKTAAWPKVKAALDVFQNHLPDFLNAIHVDNQNFNTIVRLAITTVEMVVDTILAQNPAIKSGKKSASLVDANKTKADYNQQMTTAGHPELQLK